MNSTTRLFSHVVRRVVGTSTTSTVRPRHPLLQETIRTFIVPASASASRSVSSNSLSNSMSAGNSVNGISTFSKQMTTNDDEQRRFRSNRSRRGLYDGKDIRTGNNLSFSMRHTKRTFKPNVFIKRVYSEILEEMVQFHLTTSTLRTIDKCGGLDNYLLTSKHITSGEGLKTKKRIVNTLKYRERKARQQEQAAPQA